MEIDTEIWKRSEMEHRAALSELRERALQAIFDTMTETYRFGAFSPSYIRDIAEKRLENLFPPNG